MREKVCEISIDTDENSEAINVDWFNDDHRLSQQLGILEWAKLVIIEAVKIDNALAEYNAEEV